MKKFYIKLMQAALVMLLCSITVSAHDFETDGIYYIITSDTTVEVSYKGASASEINNEYSGNVVIPDKVIYNEKTYSVTSIGKDAFYRSDSLTSITLSNSLTEIKNNAFFGCYNLTAVHVSDISTLCKIKFNDNESNPLYRAKNLFLNNEPVTDLVIPEGVTTIETFAFCGCESFTTVTIPSSVTTIGKGAFYLCTSITDLYINDLTAWCNIELSSWASPMNYAKNIYLKGELLTNLVIPENVTEIKNETFNCCSNITSVTLHDKITGIGSYAFQNCTGLTSITIPNSVTSIQQGAFAGCTGLTNVTIPESLTTLEGYTFANCTSLTNVTIPESLTTLEVYTFSGCI